eukprot:6929796-Alexandrium_andersonii.AAC.1
MESWGVWDARPISECLSRVGKRPIGGRTTQCLRLRPPGGAKAPFAGLGDPTAGPCLRPPTRGPESSPH